MPVQLLNENVFKYCKNTKEVPIYCCEVFTVFQKSFRKIRQIYLTDQAIYIVSRKKLKVRIPLDSIKKTYVGILAGQFFIVSEKNNLIIDCAQGRSKFIENIKQLSPNCQIEYVNYTTLDFLFQKHKNISSKVKLTQYDQNQKKVQLKYFTGQKLNLRALKEMWEQTASSLDSQTKDLKKQQNYELTQVILTNNYWNIFTAKNKLTNVQYTMKVYSKKFIGMQQSLLKYILNERSYLEHLTTHFTPNLVKAFYSSSNVYIICELYNGYLLEIFKAIKKNKFVNLIAQIVIAIGQLHESSLIYANLNKNGIMITLDGYVFLFNLGMSIQRGKQSTPEHHLIPPQYYQNKQAQFSWDWWNLAQLIFQLVEKRPFYEDKSNPSIQEYLRKPSDKFPPWIKMQKWEKEQGLLSLFELLIKKNSRERLGHKNDYHQILHNKYFQEWLKQHPKSQIMKKKCPPVFKKVVKPILDEKLKSNIEKQFVNDEDWSEMNSYLKDFQFSRDIE